MQFRVISRLLASFRLDFGLIPNSRFLLFVFYSRLCRSAICIYSSNGPNNCSLEFCDPLPFPLSGDTCEYDSWLDAKRFAAMHECGVALTIQDRDNIAGDTAVGAWEKRWLPRGGRRKFVSRCVSTAAELPFVRSFEEVEYEQDLWG